MHETLHRAQDPYVGGRQGRWTGTPDELLEESRKGLPSVSEMKGDLKIPRTGEVLAKNVTPTEAYDKLMDWHKEQVEKGLTTGCSI